MPGVDSYGQSFTLQSPVSSYSGKILSSYKAFGPSGQAMLAGVKFTTDNPDYFGIFDSNVNAIVAVKNSGNFGVGTTSPSAKLHVLATTEPLRLAYDATKYFSTGISSIGSVSWSLNGETVLPGLMPQAVVYGVIAFTLKTVQMVISVWSFDLMVTT